MNIRKVVIKTAPFDEPSIIDIINREIGPPDTNIETRIVIIPKKTKT